MLEDNLRADLKQAQLSRDEAKVSTLRLILSEINYSKIHKGGDFVESDVLVVLNKEAKKRKESIESFKLAKRQELASKEEAELKIIEAYLPAQMDDAELTKIVEEAINEIGANSIQDMGKVIGLVMTKASGKAEGSRVSGLVKEKLST